MTSMWLGLLPLIVAGALMPIELVITLMLLGSPGGVRSAGSAIGGMVAVRLVQGLVFGMILHWGAREETAGGHRWVVSTILLVVALLLLITAGRELLAGDDPDDPPPKWMAALASMTPSKAFLVGAGVILISVKLWIFTFGAMGIIGDSGLSRPENIVVYLVFVLLSVSTHLAIVGAATFFPHRSRALLERILRWLQDHNHVLVITIGLVFGIWILVKALHGFGL